MTRLNYQPGQWRGVVAPGAVALFPTTLDGELLERIWRTLDDGHGLSGVLEALTAEFGTNLKAIPPFAVAVASGSELRLAVRGAFRIDVSEPGASEPVTVAGDEVTTWNERVVAAAEGFVVSSDGADSSDWFAIRSGIVLCRAVSFRMAGQAGAAASAVPVVAVDAAPAPQTPEPAVPLVEPAAEQALPAETIVPDAAPAVEPEPEAEVASEPEAVSEPELVVDDSDDEEEQKYPDEATTADDAEYPMDQASSVDADASGADAEGMYTVEKIIAHRGKGRQMQYHVKWEGYPETTWEPTKHLSPDLIALKEYNESRRVSVANTQRMALRSGSSRSTTKATAHSVVWHDESSDDSDDEVDLSAALKSLVTIQGCSRS